VAGWRVPIDRTIQSGIGWLAHRYGCQQGRHCNAKYAGTEVKIENKKYLILKETDVLAIVH
jgi:hypothetical protein